MTRSSKRGALALAAVLLVCQTPSAQAAPSGGVDIANVWSIASVSRSVKPALPWSPASLKSASHFVDGLSSTLKGQIADLKKSGATLIVVRWIGANESSPLNSALPTAMQLHKFSLSGRDSTGATVGAVSDLPSSAGVQGLEQLLVRPANDSCSLSGFNLFDFSTWFQPSCDVTLPTPQQYLQYALVSKLAFATQDLYQTRISQLQQIVSAKLSFTIDGGQIRCPGLSRLWPGTQTVPLSSDSPWQGYRISVNQSQASFTFAEIKPDLKRIARAANWDPKIQNFFSAL